MHDALNHSARPQDQFIQAEYALRSVYQTYATLATRGTIGRELEQAFLFQTNGPYTRTSKAAFKAAAAALFASEVTLRADNLPMSKEWFERTNDMYSRFVKIACPPPPWGIHVAAINELRKRYERICNDFEATQEVHVIKMIQAGIVNFRVTRRLN